jgi:hypothetical protein
VTAARTAGDDVELVRVAGADHFTLIDPGTEAWSDGLAQLDRVTGGLG